MKDKKSTKKLILSKETITKLNDVEKDMVKGGTGNIFLTKTRAVDVYLCPGIPCHQQ